MDLENLASEAINGDRRALEKLASALKDDIYRLAMRMLSIPSEAEDATQDILIKIVTHLSQFRGESTFRTWAWTIATRHLINAPKGTRESFVTFELVEDMIHAGDGLVPLSSEGPETALLAEEVKIGCTGAMLIALDRKDRIAYVLSEIFGLDGAEAAKVLGITPATFRKRLQRSRSRLSTFLMASCGLADPANPCRCRRQIAVNVERGTIDPNHLLFANHPVAGAGQPIASPKERMREVEEIERAAEIFRSHPHYAAPASVMQGIRSLITSGRYRMFDA
ncbi:MAG: RNA polymerase sigma factor [Rhizobiaceae bacterium]|nr:RNA polymerase sigma factor [Rhizobiaceae bacterium]